MRTSTDATVKLMFTNKLSKTGNLTMAYEEPQKQPAAPVKSKWGAALVAEKQKGRVRGGRRQRQSHIYIYFVHTTHMHVFLYIV